MSTQIYVMRARRNDYAVFGIVFILFYDFS